MGGPAGDQQEVPEGGVLPLELSPDPLAPYPDRLQPSEGDGAPPLPTIP